MQFRCKPTARLVLRLSLLFPKLVVIFVASFLWVHVLYERIGKGLRISNMKQYRLGLHSLTTDETHIISEGDVIQIYYFVMFQMCDRIRRTEMRTTLGSILLHNNRTSGFSRFLHRDFYRRGADDVGETNARATEDKVSIGVGESAAERR